MASSMTMIEININKQWQSRSHFDFFSYTPETAEKAIAGGDADLIAFGRLYLSNPDLPDRVANSWPLAAELELKYWNSPTEVYKTSEGHVMPSYQSSL